MRRLPVGILTLALSVTVPAEAQIGLSPVQDYINKTNLLNNILSNGRATTMSQRAQAGGKPPDGANGSNRAAASATQFTPTGQPILPRVLAERTGGSPAQRQEAEKFFSSMLDLYHRTAANDGFPANDVAYAMEYFVVNGYMTYHHLHDVPYEKDPFAKRGRDSFERLKLLGEKKALKPSVTDERAVYAQIQATLAQNPQVQRMSDREKQELTELLAIMLGVNYTAYTKGVNGEDDALINQARESARQMLEKLVGAPIARIRIDANGLSQ